MNRQQTLKQLRLMQAWHEDNGDGPNADYDAICYAIGVIEEQPEGMDTFIKALEKEHKKLLEMQKALKNVHDTNVGDTISRQQAIDALHVYFKDGFSGDKWWNSTHVLAAIKGLPPAQPEPCEDAVSRQAIINALDEQLNYLSKLDVRDNPGVENKWYGINWSKNTIAELPSVTPKQRTGALKAEIRRMKRSFTTCINSDYYTGYMSALSAVEGYIAQLEGKE